MTAVNLEMQCASWIIRRTNCERCHGNISVSITAARRSVNRGCFGAGFYHYQRGGDESCCCFGWLLAAAALSILSVMHLMIISWRDNSY